MAQYIQAFFLLSASTILLAANIPPLRRTLIAYGPRATTNLNPPASQPKPTGVAVPASPTPSTLLNTLLNNISTYRVPHAYFSHFYALSTASSLFWAHQYLTNGKLLQRTCRLNSNPARDSTTTMSTEQITLVWLLFLIHSLRRQLESTLLTPPSSAKMWIGHYIVGLAFYVAMGMAIWVEGCETILAPPPKTLILLSPPRLTTMLIIPILILASGLQHDAHAYLASLPKYTLPTHPLFQRLLCPHYTAECVIYLCLTLLAAPRGRWVNVTVGAGGVFVGLNLGVTAKGVGEWWEGRVQRGEAREEEGKGVRGRWRLVPGVW